MNNDKEKLSVAFVVIGMLFSVCLITSNLLETKLFHLYGSVNLTCGFIVFPISYILNDCIAEVWGFRKARLVIWLGFLMNFFVVVLGGIACLLPPVEPGSDAAFCEVFGFAPQVAFASFTAFVTGSFLNAWVMSKMKLGAKGKERFSWHFSSRAILSTIVGESVDSLIFFPFAFYLLPLLFEGSPKVSFSMVVSLMLTQVVAKTLFEVLLLPVTIRVVQFLKKHEGLDVYDEAVSYNPIKVSDI